MHVHVSMLRNVSLGMGIVSPACILTGHSCVCMHMLSSFSWPQGGHRSLLLYTCDTAHCLRAQMLVIFLVSGVRMYDLNQHFGTLLLDVDTSS